MAQESVIRDKATLDQWDRGESVPCVALVAVQIGYRTERLRLISGRAFREGYISQVARTVPRGISNPIAKWVATIHSEWLRLSRNELDAALTQAGQLKAGFDKRRQAGLAACDRLRAAFLEAEEWVRSQQENERKFKWFQEHGPLKIRSTDGRKTWEIIQGKPFPG